MLAAIRARLARRSFDYQWGSLPTGDWLSDDPRFGAQVERIISEEELAIDPEWFQGRRVLDAGCGNGRWTDGFVRLGCEVTVIDACANALSHVRERFGDKVRTLQGDVLQADQLLAGERFDLVWSWGVLHHTADTSRGIRALERLVADDGLLYVYLYGRENMPTRVSNWKLNSARVALNLLPLRARGWLLVRLYGERGAHEAFDLLSTPLNRRTTVAEATQMLNAAGLPRVVNTIDHTEVFLRADHGAASADPYLLPLAKPPYWFQQPAEAPV